MAAILAKVLALLGLTTPAELLALTVEYGAYVLFLVLVFVSFMLRNTSHGVHLYLVTLVFALGVGCKLGQKLPTLTL